MHLAFIFFLKKKSALELNKIPSMVIFGENAYETNLYSFQYSLTCLWSKNIQEPVVSPWDF